MDYNTDKNIKQCSKCKDNKPATTEFFGPRKTGKNGLEARCRECIRELSKEYNKKHYANNKEYYHLKAKKWRVENHARQLEISRNSYHRNKEEENARTNKYFKDNPNYRKEYYAKNKEYFNESTQKWYANNKDRHKEMSKRWRLENKERVGLLVARYQHRKKGLPFDFSEDDWVQCLQHFNYKCAYCGVSEAKLQKEHFIPVSKDGGFVKGNILPACPSCNMSKQDKDFDSWYKSKDFYSITRNKKVYDYLKNNK